MAMKNYYIYNTLTNDQKYVVYETNPGGIPVPVGNVEIAGGHGRINKHLITPLGVLTIVDENQMALLKRCPLFELHQKNGFIRIETTKKDAEAVASDMETADKSRQLNPADYKKSRRKPVTNKEAE